MISRVGFLVLALCVAFGSAPAQHRTADRGTIAYSWKQRERPPEPVPPAYPWTNAPSCADLPMPGRPAELCAFTATGPCAVCRHEPCTWAHLYEKNRELISSIRCAGCVSPGYVFRLESRNDAAYSDARVAHVEPCGLPCPPPLYPERKSLQGLHDELAILNAQCRTCR